MSGEERMDEVEGMGEWRGERVEGRGECVERMG